MANAEWVQAALLLSQPLQMERETALHEDERVERTPRPDSDE